VPTQAKSTAPTAESVAEALLKSLVESPPRRGAKLLSKQEVLDRTGVSYPTIWHWMRVGRFPRARQCGEQKIAWIESEVEAWIEALPITVLKGEAHTTETADA
jgi:prophage regulatory protein